MRKKHILQVLYRTPAFPNKKNDKFLIDSTNVGDDL